MNIHRMRFRNPLIFSAILLVAIFLASCAKENELTPTPTQVRQTLIMYMPWSSDLTSYFEQNLRDFETVVGAGGLGDNRIIVFFSSSPTEATLFELKYKGGNCVRENLKTYTNPPFTTAGGITSILHDVVAVAPARQYSMVVGSHGMGWLPVVRSGTRIARDTEKFHWEYEGVPRTRFFGGITAEYQTDVTTFAEGIAGAGLKMEFILFDDCYMSSIEVAYDLRDVTNYLIAAPTEIMAYGYPYHIVGKHLINNDYGGICNGFYEFYENYQYPYGTIGLTDCSEVEALAEVMREVNARFSFDAGLLGTVQRMDGYSPVVFFDYGDYVSKLCSDAGLLARFNAQLERTVPPQYALHTRSYYSSSLGVVGISSYCGIPVSDPSVSAKATGKTSTAWHKATHAGL